MSMKPEIKKQWIEALRSGDYHQCHGALIEPDGENLSYCCLGVLTDLAAKTGLVEVTIDKAGTVSWLDSSDLEPDNWIEMDDGVLPPPVIDWAGLGSDNPVIGGRQATVRNDGEVVHGKPTPATNASPNWVVIPQTFDQIADAIEKDESL